MKKHWLRGAFPEPLNMFLAIVFLYCKQILKMRNQMTKLLSDNKDRLLGRKPRQAETKKPPILFKETQAIIKDLQRHLDGDFLVYWISDHSSMISDDVIAFNKVIQKRSGHKRLFLFIKSYGGSSKAALRIINLLRNVYEEIIALVPLDCASAATMLALGADMIKMGPLAYLSAIDTSITHHLSPIDNENDLVSVSQNELDRVIRLWGQTKEVNDTNPYKELYTYIHPLVIGAVDRASSLSIKLTREILSYHMKDEVKATQISQHLNSDYPSHSYPITYVEAQKIGLHVKPLEAKLNEKLLHLNELYSEMAQRAYTDHDEMSSHDNEILKIIEIGGEQLFYQKDKDWRYRMEEKRWIAMNDESSWRYLRKTKGSTEMSRFYIR